MPLAHRALGAFLLTCLAAAPVSADPDCGIGIYFDEAGTQRGIDAAPGSVVHAYLVAVFNGGPLPLVRFEQPYIDVGGAGGGWVEIRGGGVNDYTPWGDGDLSVDAVWDTPFMVDGPVVIADLFIEVETADPITILASCHFWGWIEGETTPLGGQHCTHCDMMPPRMTIAATINSEWVPVGAEETTWSAVKAIYR